MSWPDQIWPKSYCRQMQTYATDCKKIKFSYCLDEEAWAEIHLFRNWLHWDGLAICPTCETFSSHILGALILASGVGQSKCKCLMFTNRNSFRDSWSVLLSRSLLPFPSLCEIKVRPVENIMAPLQLYSKEGSQVSFHPFQTSSSDFEDRAPPPPSLKLGSGPFCFHALKVKCSRELIYREWSWQSYQEKRKEHWRWKALAVTEVFITLGSNGMQCTQGKVTATYSI